LFSPRSTIAATMTTEAPVQRQLEAYNARDLDRFVAEYHDDIRVFRAPSGTPVLDGKAAFTAHYAAHRFNLPNLHADVLSRMVVGNKVIDHERVSGVHRPAVRGGGGLRSRRRRDPDGVVLRCRLTTSLMTCRPLACTFSSLAQGFEDAASPACVASHAPRPRRVSREGDHR